MTRKPVDQLAKSPKPQGQDGVWATIRHLNIFTLRDIMDETDIPKATVRSFVKRLLKGGVVGKHSTLDNGAIRYVLLHDLGANTPRRRKDGTPVTQGRGVKNMWRSMRGLRVFTVKDIALHSTTDDVYVSERTVEKFCSFLEEADYLRVIDGEVRGKRHATYRLIRDTGVQSPQIQRVKQLFDPNLNEVTYRDEGRV